MPATKRRRKPAATVHSGRSKPTSVTLTDRDAVRRLDALRGKILMQTGIEVSRSLSFQLGLSALLALPNLREVLIDGAIARHAMRSDSHKAKVVAAAAEA
jgi:hypothetical protein